MKTNQKLTPKYWVVHDLTTDDVIVGTLSKALDDASIKMDTLYGSDEWKDNPKYEIILISIEEVVND